MLDLEFLFKISKISAFICLSLTLFNLFLRFLSFLLDKIIGILYVKD